MGEWSHEWSWAELTCTIFGIRHSQHEQMLEHWWWGAGTSTERRKHWGCCFLLVMCLFCFMHPSCCMVSRNKFVLSEPTVSLDLFLSQRPVANSPSEKQNFQRSYEAFANTFTTQAYHRDSRMAKILTIARFFLASVLSISIGSEGAIPGGSKQKSWLTPGLGDQWRWHRIAVWGRLFRGMSGDWPGLSALCAVFGVGTKVWQRPLMFERSTSSGENLWGSLCGSLPTQFPNNLLYVLGLSDAKPRAGKGWFDQILVPRVLFEE